MVNIIVAGVQLMSPQSFLVIWAIAFASLCLALLLLSWFYYLLASEIELHAVSKEVRICLIISFLQALNYVAAEALIATFTFKTSKKVIAASARARGTTKRSDSGMSGVECWQQEGGRQHPFRQRS
jgi:hypothetical protein